eukprot:scaffold45520_cov64-Phaeocystis_antarctica.AAC.14
MTTEMVAAGQSTASSEKRGSSSTLGREGGVAGWRRRRGRLWSGTVFSGLGVAARQRGSEAGERPPPSLARDSARPPPVRWACPLVQGTPGRGSGIGDVGASAGVARVALLLGPEGSPKQACCELGRFDRAMAPAVTRVEAARLGLRSKRPSSAAHARRAEPPPSPPPLPLPQSPPPPLALVSMQ